jgi:hypothetical protein
VGRTLLDMLTGLTVLSLFCALCFICLVLRRMLRRRADNAVMSSDLGSRRCSRKTMTCAARAVPALNRIAYGGNADPDALVPGPDAGSSIARAP